MNKLEAKKELMSIMIGMGLKYNMTQEDMLRIENFFYELTKSM